MSWLLLLMVSLLTSAGQLCQKQAMLQWQAPNAPSLWRNNWLVAGLAAMGVGLLLWIWLLQQLPLGLAYPMLSLNFIWVNLAAHYWFKEPLTPRHWLGTLAILLGISMLGVAK